MALSMEVEEKKRNTSDGDYLASGLIDGWEIGCR
jgi:hypothetical protein